VGYFIIALLEIYCKDFGKNIAAPFSGHGVYTLSPKNVPGLISCNLAKTEHIFNFF